jgi:hypothetical protein
MIKILGTERRNGVVKAPASYLRGPRFKYRILIDDVCGFPQSLQANVRIAPFN